jgi:hypothetical protein
MENSDRIRRLPHQHLTAEKERTGRTGTVLTTTQIKVCVLLELVFIIKGKKSSRTMKGY